MGLREKNPGALRELSERIKRCTEAGLRIELSQNLAATGLKVLADEFRGSYGPYGERWEAPKLRNGPPLTDTRLMANSAAVEPRPNGFRLTITKHFAPMHQKGMTIYPKNAARLTFRTRDGRWHSLAYAVIPKRQMVPERATGGLGPIWGEAFNRTAGDLLRRRLGAVA